MSEICEQNLGVKCMEHIQYSPGVKRILMFFYGTIHATEDLARDNLRSIDLNGEVISMNYYDENDKGFLAPIRFVNILETITSSELN